MDWDKATTELTKKLDPANVRPAKQFGPKGDYIEGWHAMAEANRIFGFGGWSYTVQEMKCVSERQRRIGKEPNAKDGFGVSYTAMVCVIVGDLRREDVGSGHGYDVDCGLAHESAIKEAVTDALKRALRSFGNPFGLALYDKSRENVGIDEPAFDASGCLSRLMTAIPRRQTKQELQQLWADETDARIALKGADPAKYDTFFEAFKSAGTKAIDDPALQSSNERSAA